MLNKTFKITKKDNLALKTQIETINSTLIKFYNGYKVKNVIRNNFDIKAVILRLFFCSFLINMMLTGLSLTANLIYGGSLFFKLFNIKIDGDTIGNWKWEIGLPIINILFVVFIISTISSAYKLSLRGNYRNNYIKLLFLDICTLNIFNIIGTLIFIFNKKHMLPIHDDFTISDKNLNSQNVNSFFKPIFKLEIKILLSIILVFLIALVIGYFVPDVRVKLICLSFIFISIAMVYITIMCDLAGLIVVQLMFKKLLVNNSYYYFLSALRISMYFCGAYALSILLVVLNFDEVERKNILENI